MSTTITSTIILHDDPWFRILRYIYGNFGVPLYPYPWSSNNDNRKHIVRWVNFLLNTILNLMACQTLSPQYESSYYHDMIKKYHQYGLLPMYMFLNILLIRPSIFIGYWFVYSTRVFRIVELLMRKDCFIVRLSNHRCYIWIFTMVLFHLIFLFYYRLDIVLTIFHQIAFDPIRLLMIHIVYDSYSMITWSLFCYHQVLNILTLRWYLMAISQQQQINHPNNYYQCHAIIKSLEKFSRVNIEIRQLFSPLWIIQLTIVCSSHFNTIILLFIEGWQRRWHKIHRDILVTFIWITLVNLNQQSLSIFDQINNRIRQMMITPRSIYDHRKQQQIKQFRRSQKYLQQSRYVEFELLRNDFEMIIYDNTLHIHSVLFLELIAFVIYYVCIILLS
ncbi:uncharacterized protein LOC124500381 [Dermatophagoides farinae]|uniref:uncharacterized protein LOC124500381 n=1 Tax=Dermatophagoides farinae TaxID=6954 RepID=UPI003F628497